jgi:hypothetical protein
VVWPDRHGRADGAAYPRTADEGACRGVKCRRIDRAAVQFVAGPVPPVDAGAVAVATLSPVFPVGADVGLPGLRADWFVFVAGGIALVPRRQCGRPPSRGSARPTVSAVASHLGVNGLGSCPPPSVPAALWPGGRGRRNAPRSQA